MRYITVDRDNGSVTFVRTESVSATESPLTQHEQIINELYNKLANIKKTHLSISKAKRYAEFIIISERRGLPLVSLEDYLIHY